MICYSLAALFRASAITFVTDFLSGQPTYNLKMDFFSLTKSQPKEFEGGGQVPALYSTGGLALLAEFL